MSDFNVETEGDMQSALDAMMMARLACAVEEKSLTLHTRQEGKDGDAWQPVMKEAQ